MTETYHHGNLRNDLVSEGIKMLTRDGIASFSLRRLSQELGVSHAAAYRHFSSKEDLLRAIFVEASTRFREALIASVKPDASGEDALYQLGVGYVKFFVANPEILSLFSLVPVEGGLLSVLLDAVQPSDAEQFECSAHRDCTDIDALPETSGFGFFRKIALSAQEESPYRDLSEREILLGFWGKVHGIATILVTQKNFIPEGDLERAIESVVRTPF